MQKFTVFSILLSLTVVLILGDILFHNYLGAGAQEEQEEAAEEENTSLLETSSVELAEEPSEILLEPELEPALEPELEPELESMLRAELFTEAGFLKPVLKTTAFSTYIFQFISFSDQSEASITQWNLFDGEQYIGSIYEMRYPTETGSFQGYLAARERAMGLPSLGEVNEVNLYGDASFYFNHKTKTKTVHMVLRSGSDLYAFEYGLAHHEKMKKVFDIVARLI